MLRDIMLAQAQACLFEKASLKQGMNDGLIG